MLKLISFVSLSLLTITNVVHCKPEYLFYEEAGGWLKLHRIPATWEKAFLRCHQEGAVLASPLNEQLADAINSLIRETNLNKNFFLGTHDLYSKGHFVSVEGVKLTDMVIKWDSHGDPGYGDCLCISSSTAMYTCLCKATERYMCYRKLDNQTMNECGTFDNEYHFKRCTGSCYKLHQQTRTWSQAFGICESEGGHLVILNDREEASIVKDLFPERSEQGVWDRFHVGLAAWTDDRIWTTIHGEKFDDVFNVWHVDQPNNVGGKQDRVSFVREGALDDIDPDFKAMFVCEKSPQSIQFEMPENLQGQGTEELYQLK